MNDSQQPRSFDEHRTALLAGIAALPPVTVDLTEAIGSTLAAGVRAAVALPRFDHAAMDGYAVRAADAPGRLPVVATLEAGDGPHVLAPGTAVQIMTGAPVPHGADAVVAFEEADRVTDPGGGLVGGEAVAVGAVAAGAHVRRAAEDVAHGELVAGAGSVLDPRTAGLAAATGVGRVQVHRTPRLVVLTTGAELVPAGTDPAHLREGAVHDSTAVTLLAEARARGFHAVHRGPVGDDPEDFLVLLHEAVREADLVVTTGGVSAGTRDVVKAALRRRTEFWFGPVAVRPGRPQGHGTLTVDGADGRAGRRSVPVITLPGTPSASALTFLAFVVPVLEALAGRTPSVSDVELAAPVRRRPDRTVLLAAAHDERGRAVVLPGHVGHSQRLLAAAELVLVVPPGDGEVAEGARIGAIALGRSGPAATKGRR